jgi:hypothetical protein
VEDFNKYYWVQVLRYEERKNMKKLSEDLRELADRVADAEDKATAAEQASKEKVQASIAKSKAAAKARQEAFKAQVNAKQAASAQQWEDLRANYNQKVLQIKGKIDTEKDAHEVKRAKRRAVAAAAYAEDAIRFAMLAIDEAELAVLEAIEADVYAESLA